MKKGLLTVLLASLVVGGCQNYDDQFDDLNAQISALKSQVDGLSSLTGQVSSLSGTIRGLSSGVAAAQAAAQAAGTSAQAATAAANAIDLTGLAASLATLQTEVDAVQASLATAATASAVTTLQAELDAIELSLADLLASSNIYSTDVTVTNATTLNSALALGNKLNVLNATLTITGFAAMDYAQVQTLVDRVQTTTGNIVYSAGGSTGTEIVFNNLTSAANITMTQPGGYHFPKLTNAGVINLEDTYETLVTRVNFPLLSTVTGLQTDAADDTLEFTYATNVDLGSLVVTPNASMSITTKKDATLDIGSLKAVDAAGTGRATYSLTLNGPASFTNGTAAGTFASTGLPGNTVGLYDGTINLTNVATAAIHNFRGDIVLNTGVKNFTGNNIVRLGTGATADVSSATDLETVNVTFIRDNDPANSSATTADLGEENMNTAQDVSFDSTHTKLTSLTLTGKGGDVTANASPALATVDLTSLTAFDVNMTGNVALASFTDASSANDWTFTNNDLMTSLSASHTTTMTTGSGSTDTAASVTITGNAEIASLAIGFDDVDVLNITSNAKLATITGGTALKDNGSSTTTNVDIHQNALVASLVRDTKESPSATVVDGAASDTGSITTTSGIKDLDAFLTDAKAATGIVSVWFDTVTKLEIQSDYGGSYTDTTASVTAPTAWDDTTAAANAVLRQSGTYAGIYSYMFSRDASDAVTNTTGARAAEYRTWAYDVGRNAGSYSDKALATNEGITVSFTGGTAVFKQGDTYNGSTVNTVDQLVAYMNADTNLDAIGIDIQADRAAFERTLATVTFTQSTGSAAKPGTISGTGRTAYNITNTETGAQSLIYASHGTDADGVAQIVDDLILAINGATIADTDNDITAAAGTNDDQIVLTRNISGGGVADNSPLAVNINIIPVIDAAMVSTTAMLLGDDQVDYGATTGGSANSGGVISNTGALASSLFAFTVTETALSGIRVTLKNTGSLAFTDAASVYGAAVSNTAVLTGNATYAGNQTAASGDKFNLVLGTNAPAYADENGIASYVTAFTDISSGTTTTTTDAVTAVDTDRTGW
jgi:hypothetical protein